MQHRCTPCGARAISPAPTPKAIAFTTERVAAGAAELRDMITSAWAASADETVGYQPDIGVRAAEAGQPVPMAALLGSD